MWALFVPLSLPLILPLVVAWLAFAFSTSAPPKRSLAGYAIGLAFLGASTFVCIMAAFVVAGGPDGRFLKADTLMGGLAATAVCVVLALVAVRLLWLRWRTALWFSLPILLTVLARGSANFVNTPFLLVLAAFVATPLLCMIGILVLSYRTVRRHAATHDE